MIGQERTKMLGIIEPYPIMRNRWFVYLAISLIIIGLPVVCFAFVTSLTFDNHYSLLVLQPNHDIIYIFANIYFLFLSVVIFLMSKGTKILSTVAFGVSVFAFALEVFLITHKHTPMLSQTWLFIVVFLFFGFIYLSIDSRPGRTFSWSILAFSILQLWSTTFDPKNFSVASTPYKLDAGFTTKWSFTLLIPLTIAIVGLVIYLLQLLPKDDFQKKDSGTVITY